MYQIRCPKCDTRRTVTKNDETSDYQVPEDSNHTVKSFAEALRGISCPNCNGHLNAVKAVEN